MAANSRLTIAVHALAWMTLAQQRGRDPLTSDQIAASVNTNPVIIRRSLGDLRRAGLVEVRRGAGAGWSLARPAEEITLLAVYEAVEHDPLFGLHHSEPNLECPVGLGIRPALSSVYGGIEETLRRELAATSVADVLRRTLVRYPIVELRQYTLHPGRRDELIDLFDSEFVETQEATGMAVIGQFRDLDDPDRFVWLRGFADMPSRAAALTSFYGGPVWKAHREQANATMIDSDDVLLLRPATDHSGFPEPPAARGSGDPHSRVLATIHYGDRPFDQQFIDDIGAGIVPLACLTTEYSENTFPALPVRTGEHVLVWFARFPSLADLDEYVRQAEPAPVRTERLRLAPTARSLLR